MRNKRWWTRWGLIGVLILWGLTGAASAAYPKTNPQILQKNAGQSIQRSDDVTDDPPPAEESPEPVPAEELPVEDLQPEVSTEEVQPEQEADIPLQEQEDQGIPTGETVYQEESETVNQEEASSSPVEETAEEQVPEASEPQENVD